MKLYNCSVIDKRDFTKFKREKDFGSNYILAWPLRAVSILDKTSFYKILGGLKAARIMLNENCSITVYFYRRLGPIVADLSVIFPKDAIISTTNLAASSLHEIIQWHMSWNIEATPITPRF